MVGSARGLRKRDCNSTPAAARDAPTKKPTITRGMRINHTITIIRLRDLNRTDVHECGRSFNSTTWRMVIQEMCVLPIPTAASSEMKRIGNRNI